MDQKIFPILSCNKNNFFININQNEIQDSEFDSLIKEKWEKAQSENLFRYKLDIQQWKLLDGQYKFLTQLNVNRSENRRKPEEITSMSQPFNPERFHFNKISNEEILFDIECGDGNNVIAINISPIERYHCLFIPQRLQNLPQIATKKSVQNILELIMMSNSKNIRAIFNSLGAFASVNHLHWHLYYLEHRMPLENIVLENIAGSPVYLLLDFPSKGFCVKFSSLKNKIVSNLTNWVFLIINYLQNENIAHNVYITRGNSTQSEPNFDDIRVYIWARKHDYGIKNTRAFYPAVCELFGHLSIRNQEDYASMTEMQVAEILKDITEETFSSVKEKVIEIIQQQLLLENKNVGSV